MVTLAGETVLSCSVRIPAWGRWWADVELELPAELSGSVVLELPGLALTGTVVSGGPCQGRARYRVVAGAGGWGRTIASRSYTNDAGVAKRTVIRDAADACGETLDESTATGTIGSHYMREAGPASRVLGLLAARAWYVDEDGVTKLGARPAVAYTGIADVMRADPAQIRIDLAADDLAGLVPGALVEGLPTGAVEAVDVEHRLMGDKLRTSVWGAAGATSRAGSALYSILAALLAQERYRGCWSYRIISQSGERLDLQPERASTGMHDLRHVRVRPGVPGVRADNLEGSMVLVTFVDANPARPVVVAFEDADGDGFEADVLDLASPEIGLTAGAIYLEGGLSGAIPWESAASAESVVNLINNIGIQIGVQIPGTLTGVALAAQWQAILLAAIPACVLGSIAPYKAAIVAALLAKPPDPTQQLPNLGWPDVNGA